MNKKNRSQLALGLILLLAAAWLVAIKMRPELAAWMNITFDWPLWVIGAGAIILLIGLLTGAPRTAVPAFIVTGIGGILYYCNATNDWGSWAYMWSLIPGFVGIGVLLSGLIGGTFRQEARHGLNLVLISAVLFAIFGAFFGGFKLFGPYAEYGPIALLFLFGLWLIARGIFRR